ncbi:hypothetical protein ACHQM5_023438 [Ranunculus cassubicifolius]
MSQWYRATSLLKNSLKIQPPFSSSYHTIQAIPREITGTRISSRDRSQGRIPTVVFSQDQQDPSKPISRKQLLTTETKQIKSILKSVQLNSFCSTKFQLQIRAGAGSSHLLDSGTVLPVKIHRDAETGKILNLVLVWANEGSEFDVNVPIVFKGEDAAPGLKKGGYFQKIRESLRYQCPVDHIPPKIEVDVSKLDIGDRVFAKDIEVHPSLKLLSCNEDKPICKVRGTMPEPKTKTTKKTKKTLKVKEESSTPVAA